MAKKRRKKNLKHSEGTHGRYTVMLNQGRTLLERYWNNQARGKHGRLTRIYKHYSRESVQQAMYEYAIGRKIATLRQFRPLFPSLKKPEDILPLAFYFADRGKLWPSFHGTISRSVDGNRLLDLVLEVDFKPRWKTAFESARPIVKFLQDFGVDFKVKFSGHSSPHIIIPSEAFPPEMGHSVHMQIMQYANKHVRGKGHLDMSFQSTNHFLRLLYSINENTGGVSVPIYPAPGNPNAYDNFSPEKARIENVKIIKNWWNVPEDAPDRTSEMIKFVLERKTISIPKTVRPAMLRKIPAKQFQNLSTQLLMARSPKMRTAVMRRLQMPYEQMLKTGQELFQQRDDLMQKPNIREAMEMLKSIHEKSGVVSTHEAADKYEVEPADLWFLWRWHLRQGIFDYYARDDVQEAMFLHSIDRQVQLGSEDIVVELSDPADIPLLAAYIHETQGAIDYPSFYCTNTKCDVTTEDIIGCDVVVRIDGKGDGAAAERMARRIASILQQVGADFALLIGVEASVAAKTSIATIQSPVLDVIIPAEATPGMPRNEEQFTKVIETMQDHLKRVLPHSQDVSVLSMGEYIPLFYSVNGTSGSANIPVRVDKLDAEFASDSLRDVQVKRDWWDIPGEASAEMEELFARITTG